MNKYGGKKEYLILADAYVILAVAKKRYKSVMQTQNEPPVTAITGGSSLFWTVEHPLG